MVGLCGARPGTSERGPGPLLRLIALAALIAGVLLGLGELAAPDCRNATGAADDSRYPCRIEHSGGTSEYAFSRTTNITVPRAEPLAIGLVIIGVIGVGITRRR